MLALDPSQTYPVVLSLDAARPQAEQTRFIFRFMTCRQRLEVNRLIHAVVDDLEKDNQTLNKAILVGGLAVESPHVKPGTQPAEILDDLTLGEKWELVNCKLRAARLSEEDKKKSASRPPGDTSRSAAPAVPAATAEEHND